MTFTTKAQMSKELRKVLDASEFYSRFTAQHGGPHIYYVTTSGSTLSPVSVWVEKSRFTIFERAGGYDETHLTEIEEVIDHLKKLSW
ncbi:hypothetical protein ACIBI9_31380 [Nonomuraea sp. NPDC050451]|uniref:hypothetical protein n=1 Tax=Nonomuraea sp. NPDC050451 TaxID=3364364 RepID=UPI0037A02E1B